MVAQGGAHYAAIVIMEIKAQRKFTDNGHLCSAADLPNSNLFE